MVMIASATEPRNAPPDCDDDDFRRRCTTVIARSKSALLAAYGGTVFNGAAFLDRTVKLLQVFVGEPPAHRPGVLLDLVSPFGARKRTDDSGPVNRPVEHDLSDRLANTFGDLPHAIHEILVPSPLVAPVDRVLRAAVARVELMVPLERPGEQPFHERPIARNGRAVLQAPWNSVSLDVALQHI